MTTAEWEDKARAFIEEYWGYCPTLVDVLTPYYANIIREFDDSDGIILRGMVHGAFEFYDKYLEKVNGE